MLHLLRCSNRFELDQMRKLVFIVRGVDINVMLGSKMCLEGVVNCGRVQVQAEHSLHLVMNCAQVRSTCSYDSAEFEARELVGSN